MATVVTNELGKRVLAILEAQEGGYRTTATSEKDRVLVNIDQYPVGAKGVLFYEASIANAVDATTPTCKMQTEAGVDVTGATVTLASTEWAYFKIGESAPFTVPSGLQSFKFVIGANNVSSRIQLHIVL
jgi:hypothetical protein